MYLFDILQKISTLPQNTHRDAVASTISEWRQKNPLVDKVAKGETTFEASISELANENIRLRFLDGKDTCNNRQFQDISKKTLEDFKDVLSFWSLRSIGRGLVFFDLTATADFKAHVKWAASMFLGATIFMSAVICVLSVFIAEIRPFILFLSCVSVGFGLFLTIANCLTAYPHNLRDRRNLAKEKLEEARFLDKMFSLVKK
ncbi:MAG: hypothetical protein V4664_04110 [Patescibacteria group bacterium]